MNELLQFEQGCDQLIAGVKDNQMAAIAEAREVIAVTAFDSKRRYLVAMLRALQREVRREEERKRDGR